MYSASADADSYCYALFKASYITYRCCYAYPYTQSDADCHTMADDRHAHFRPCFDPNANAPSNTSFTTHTAEATNTSFAAPTTQPTNANPANRNTSPSSS